jgi:L-2-hydroxyglutarate oxidase
MTYTHTIVGAGIVGLATGIKLLEKYPGAKILIIEKESGIAKHQTGNNSGVIHSGIYYKPGSLKAKNCRAGYKMLLKFCDEHKVKYELCGKVIAAVNEAELPQLEKIYDRGVENGLENLKKLSAPELKNYEPNINGLAGVFIPQTGIINYSEVCDKMYQLLLDKSVDFRFGEKVLDINNKNPIEIITQKQSYFSDYLITCGGLYSDKLAGMTERDLRFRIIPFRGEYYKLKPDRQSLVNNLIYPVPNPDFPFLGVHFTRMINGQVECGPNAVFAFKKEGYKKFDFSFSESFDSLFWPGFRKVARKYWRTGLGEFYRSFSKKAFVKALQKLLPEIEENDLIPAAAGVRAQACDKDGGLLDDFYILENKNILHVCNAPSPAATSSLAIGDYIANKVLISN